MSPELYYDNFFTNVYPQIFSLKNINYEYKNMHLYQVHFGGFWFWVIVVQSLQVVSLSATSRTAAYQASLSFTVSQTLPKLTSVESVMPSNHLILNHKFSFYLQTFQASGSFPMSQLFTSGGQSIGASALASIIPVNIQGWSPLGLTGLASLQSKGLSRIFSSTRVPRHQFFGALPYGPTLTSVHVYWKDHGLGYVIFFALCCLGLW